MIAREKAHVLAVVIAASLIARVAAAQPTPDPAQPAPDPVQPAPAPVQTAPAPVQTAPAPVQTAPAPVQTAPAPVELAPDPWPQAAVEEKKPEQKGLTKGGLPLQLRGMLG